MAVLKIIFLFLLIGYQEKLVQCQAYEENYYVDESTEETETNSTKLSADNELTHVRTKNLSGNVRLTTLQVLTTNPPLDKLNNEFENEEEDILDETTSVMATDSENKQDEVQTITENQQKVALLSEVRTKAPTDGMEPLSLMDVVNSTSGTLPDQASTEKLITVTSLNFRLIREDSDETTTAVNEKLAPGNVDDESNDNIIDAVTTSMTTTLPEEFAASTFSGISEETFASTPALESAAELSDLISFTTEEIASDPTEPHMGDLTTQKIEEMETSTTFQESVMGTPDSDYKYQSERVNSVPDNIFMVNPSSDSLISREKDLTKNSFETKTNSVFEEAGQGNVTSEQITTESLGNLFVMSTTMNLEQNREDIEDLSSFMNVDEEFLNTVLNEYEKNANLDESIEDISLILKKYNNDDESFEESVTIRRENVENESTSSDSYVTTTKRELMQETENDGRDSTTEMFENTSLYKLEAVTTNKSDGFEWLTTTMTTFNEAVTGNVFVQEEESFSVITEVPLFENREENTTNSAHLNNFTTEQPTDNIFKEYNTNREQTTKVPEDFQQLDTTTTVLITEKSEDGSNFEMTTEDESINQNESTVKSTTYEDENFQEMNQDISTENNAKKYSTPTFSTTTNDYYESTTRNFPNVEEVFNTVQERISTETSFNQHVRIPAASFATTTEQDRFDFDKSHEEQEIKKISGNFEEESVSSTTEIFSDNNNDFSTVDPEQDRFDFDKSHEEQEIKKISGNFEEESVSSTTEIFSDNNNDFSTVDPVDEESTIYASESTTLSYEDESETNLLTFFTNVVSNLMDAVIDATPEQIKNTFSFNNNQDAKKFDEGTTFTVRNEFIQEQATTPIHPLTEPADVGTSNKDYDEAANKLATSNNENKEEAEEFATNSNFNATTADLQKSNEFQYVLSDDNRRKGEFDKMEAAEKSDSEFNKQDFFVATKEVSSDETILTTTYPTVEENPQQEQSSYEPLEIVTSTSVHDTRISTLANSLLNFLHPKFNSTTADEPLEEIDIDDDEHEEEEEEEPQISVKVNEEMKQFSIKITDNDSSYFVPSDALVTIRSPNIVYVTWKSSIGSMNNTLALNLENSVQLNVVKGTKMHIYKKALTETKNKGHVDNKLITLDEGIQIYFSNTEFLRIDQKNQTAPAADALPSVPTQTALAAEITGGCIGILVIIGFLVYWVLKKYNKTRNFKPNGDV